MTRRRINRSDDPVLSVQIGATKVQRLVYLIVSNKPVRYKKKQSKIVYIGTTKNGVRRIAASASRHIASAADKLKFKGVKRLDAFVVWARSKVGPQRKKGYSHWALLERAMLIEFRELFGETPRLNRIGHRLREKHEFETFSRKRIQGVLTSFR